MAKIIVIGAGVMGASVAYRLAQAGASVTVLEATRIGGGTSGISFAWTNAHSKPPRAYHELNVAGMKAHAALRDDFGATPWWHGGGSLEWEPEAARAAETAAICRVLRDIMGNPFRVASVDPSWATWNGAIIVKLAESIYEERAFDQMPILADALEEAGCTEQTILDHLRGPGPAGRPVPPGPAARAGCRPGPAARPAPGSRPPAAPRRPAGWARPAP